MKYHSKAVRLTDAIVRDIWEGSYEVGKYLPGEGALAERYRVSRTTIRRVLELLGAEGVVIKEPNRGSLINPGLKRETLPRNSAQAAPGIFTIGALWATMPDALTIGISEGIRSYARENGLEFHLFQSTEGYEKVLPMLRGIEEAGIDGIVTLPFGNADYAASIRSLAERNFPIVCVDRPVEGAELSCVEVDNYSGVYSAVVRMLTTFRRPVHYLGTRPQNKPQRLRYEGYCSAMTDGGFRNAIGEYTVFFTDPRYQSGDPDLEPASSAALELLRNAELPVSIMAMNDYTATHVYTAARRLGVAIGRDAAVFGFDDLPLAECMECPLSSIRQPRFEIGYEAARILHDRLTRKISSPIHKVFPVEIIERESSSK